MIACQTPVRGLFLLKDNRIYRADPKLWKVPSFFLCNIRQHFKLKCSDPSILKCRRSMSQKTCCALGGSSAAHLMLPSNAWPASSPDRAHAPTQSLSQTCV